MRPWDLHVFGLLFVVHVVCTVVAVLAIVFSRVAQCVSYPEGDDSRVLVFRRLCDVEA